MERNRSSKRKGNQTVIDVDTTVSFKSANDNDASSTSTMRKPLSEIINFNLIPTQTLWKLCSNSISASEAQSLLLKSQAPIFPATQLPVNSEPHIVSESDSRSATSIGSSNFSVAPNTQPNNPTTVPRSSSSSKKPNPTGDNGSKILISSHPKTLENLKGQRKTDVSPNTYTIAKKTKNKEKVTPVLLSSTPEKTKDKGKAIAAPFDSTPAANTRDKEKEISVHFRSSNVESTWDKGKSIYVPLASTSAEKTKEKGKAVAHEELEDIANSTPVLMNSRPSKKLEKNRKSDAILLSCPPRLLGTRNFGNELDQAGDVTASKSWTDPPQKARKKKCSQQQSFSESSLPEEYLKQQKAYFEEVDAFELPVEEVSVYDSD